jgi:heme/copper-type cytochrome/quinol oxidase subunit 2
MDKNELATWVTLIASFTLCVTVLAMVTVFMFGFFNPEVDNNKLFEIVGPAFQTIVGGFIGLITGIKIGSDAE